MVLGGDMASARKPPPRKESPTAAAAPRDGELRGWLLQHGPALRRYFLRRADAADADDLVQEVFLALQARGGGAPIDNVEGYLFRTAANVLGMRRRKGGWRWGWQEDVETAEDLVDDLSPERILIAKQALEQVVAALSSMPPRTAQAFFLYRFGQLSQEEVARRMGVSLKAVEKFLRKAMRYLLDHMEQRP